jgi:hypothetical protein
MNDFEEIITSIRGIPLEHIQSILKIDPSSPSGLMWTPRDLHHNQKDNCGCVSIGEKDGYRRFTVTITYNKKKHTITCSQIIFLLANGFLTEGKYIDHIDCNSLNNKIKNLREVTVSQNCQNSRISKNNKSGYKGIHWHKSGKKWLIKIRLKRKLYYFGLYENLEEAIQVCIAARAKLHGEFGRDK